MKKVGIITIIDYKNYGNRLQNYATQEVIKSIGCDVETIVNYPYDTSLRQKFITMIKRGDNFKTILYSVINLIKRKILKIFKIDNQTEAQALDQLRIKNFIETSQN